MCLLHWVVSYDAKRWPIESERSFDVQFGQCSGGQPAEWLETCMCEIWTIS